MVKFSFGQNWQSYSKGALTKERIEKAREDFYLLMPKATLKGARFLDIGFGQGLSLCLAAEAGADVIGIDIDKDNIKAFEETYAWFRAAPKPTVKAGSILDPKVMQKMTKHGPFDIVHSWGVLHHTGAMWQAMKNAAELTRNDGHLIISIYNKHWSAPAWKVVKVVYSKLSAPLQRCMESLFAGPYYTRIYILAKQNPDIMGARGMEIKHDLRDWLGGYPYEYASIDEIVGFMRQQGMVVIKKIPCKGFTGCNELIFKRSADQ